MQCVYVHVHVCVCVCVCCVLCVGGGEGVDGEEKKTRSFHIIIEICKKEI